MNRLEIHFEFVGEWHIGITQSGNFINYSKNTNIYFETIDDQIDLAVTFLGKDHINNSSNFAKVTKIYYNDLLLNELLRFSEFNTDNIDYKIIKICDYINLNGIWHLQFSSSDIKNILEERLT